MNRISLHLTAFAAALSASLNLEGEEGQTLVEYALILALIAIVVTGALIFLQGDISSLFSHVGNKL